ncbi:MAG: hypothetical protein J6X18_14785 [Bacteroidales bacterium]|nr:hypothetical protein [Bacteroidales bacterium]
MENKQKTKLTLESYGNVISWESPYTDASMEDLLYAFYGLCVGATWLPKTVLENMRDFAEEHLSVYENNITQNIEDNETNY